MLAGAVLGLVLIVGPVALSQEQLSGAEPISDAVMPPNDYEGGRGLITLRGPTGLFLNPTNLPLPSRAEPFLTVAPTAIEYGYDMGETVAGTSALGPSGFYVTDEFAYLGVLPENELPTDSLNVVSVQTASLRNGCEGMRREVSVSVARPGLPTYESDDEFVGNPGRGHNLVASFVVNDCQVEFFYLENVNGEYQGFQSRIGFFNWDDGRTAVTSFVGGPPTFSGLFSVSVARTTAPEFSQEETFGFQSDQYEFSIGEELFAFPSLGSIPLEELGANPPFFTEMAPDVPPTVSPDPGEPDPGGSDPAEEGPEQAESETDSPGTEGQAESAEDESGTPAIALIAIGGLVGVAAAGTGIALRRRKSHEEGPLVETVGGAAGPTLGPPVPYTAAERFVITYGKGGMITSEQSQMKAVADSTMERVFNAPAAGVWLFTELDRYILEPGETVPEDAVLLGFWDDSLGAVVDTDKGEGAVIAFKTARLRYRFDADGNLLRPFAYDPTPAVSFMDISFYQNKGTYGIPVAYANVWDKETKRLFTSVTSRPTELIERIWAENDDSLYVEGGRLDPSYLEAESKTVEEAIVRVVEGAKSKGVVAEWTNDPEHSLHKVSRYMSRTLFFPVPADWDPPRSGSAEVEHSVGDVGSSDPPSEDTEDGDDAVAVKVGSLATEYLDHQFDTVFSRSHEVDEVWMKSAVQAAIDNGAPCTDEGWVPIDRRAWNSVPIVHRSPSEVESGVSPDTFTGVLVNRYNGKIRSRSRCLAWEDSDGWDKFVSICGRLGIDPLQDYDLAQADGSDLGRLVLEDRFAPDTDHGINIERSDAIRLGGDGVVPS